MSFKGWCDVVNSFSLAIVALWAVVQLSAKLIAKFTDSKTLDDINWKINGRQGLSKARRMMKRRK